MTCVPQAVLLGVVGVLSLPAGVTEAHVAGAAGAEAGGAGPVRGAT